MNKRGLFFLAQDWLQLYAKLRGGMLRGGMLRGLKLNDAKLCGGAWIWPWRGACGQLNPRAVPRFVPREPHLDSHYHKRHYHKFGRALDNNYLLAADIVVLDIVMLDVVVRYLPGTKPIHSQPKHLLPQSQ